MRKKLAVGVGLVAVVLAIAGPPFVTWSARSYELPLRVGMTEEEVQAALGNLPSRMGDSGGVAGAVMLWQKRYDPSPDWLGNRESIQVTYVNSRVTSWEIEPRSRTRPHWLSAAAKWFGW